MNASSGQPMAAVPLLLLGRGSRDQIAIAVASMPGDHLVVPTDELMIAEHTLALLPKHTARHAAGERLAT
jgi:hypothetical protein